MKSKTINKAQALIQKSKYSKAIDVLKKYVMHHRGNAEAHELLSYSYAVIGEYTLALNPATRSVKLSPTVNNLIRLAEIYRRLGKLDDALKLLRKVISLDSHNSMGFIQLGIVLSQSNQHLEAIEYYEQGIKLTPDNPNAFLTLGVSLHRLGRYEDAITAFNSVISFSPESDRAMILKANSLHQLNRFEESQECNEKAQQIRWNPLKVKDPKLQGKRFRKTSAHKLRHDAEQFEYLAANNINSKDMLKKAKAYRDILEELDLTLGTIQQLNDSQQLRLGQKYNTRMHIRKTTLWPRDPINKDLDCEGAEEKYIKNSGVTYVDDFLEPDFLNELRAYCLESTMWSEIGKDRGYIGAYQKDGFNSVHLQQLAVSIRERFPNLIGNLPLENMWAYKYDSCMSGIQVHADEAVVNLNFWITPDDACLDKDYGGLEVYTKEAPKDWEFSRFNSEPDLIEEYIAGTESVEIPYKQNRAVIFNSNLFHKTQDYRFEDKYESRRINITMLFGQRIRT